MIRLISAVPISILGSLLSARYALFHLFKLGANTAVVDLALEFDQQTTEQARIGVLLQDNVLAGNYAEFLAQLIHQRRFQRARAHDSRFDPPLGFVEQAP